MSFIKLTAVSYALKHAQQMKTAVLLGQESLPLSLEVRWGLVFQFWRLEKIFRNRFKIMYLIKFHRCFIIYQKLNKAKTFNRMKNDQSQLTFTQNVKCLVICFSLQLHEKLLFLSPSCREGN